MCTGLCSGLLYGFCGVASVFAMYYGLLCRLLGLHCVLRLGRLEFVGGLRNGMEA